MARYWPWLCGFCALCLAVQCGSQEVPGFERKPTAPAELSAHSEIFERRVEEVAPGVHLAIGYGLANSIMIVGVHSRVIVDCMESAEAARDVRSAFDRISDLPLEALVYTHNHTDHVFGARAMAGQDQPEVIAHERMPELMDKVAAVVRDVTERRAYRMFGTHLDEAALVNCGIGPELRIGKGSVLDVLRPTTTFRDSLVLILAGKKMVLYHAPGETEDQLFLWIPEQRVLLCGDNVYRSFPNLYTIRGTANRDLQAWTASIDKMRYLRPEVLVPSHTEALIGADTVAGVLTAYRDAIQYVHDQTVRGMNQGKTPDQLAEQIVLPPHLAEHPWLRELYGKVEWSVRSVFNGYLGWFEGNPASLHPLVPRRKAEQIEALAGGREALIEAMIESEEDDPRWALELAEQLRLLYPEDEILADAHYRILMTLGEAESNPNARHYYLTSALEVHGLELQGLAEPSTDMVHNLPLEVIFRGLAAKLVPERAIDKHQQAEFRFSDNGETWTLIVRQGIAEIQPFALPEPDLIIETDSDTWKEIAAELRSPLSAWFSGDLRISGGKLNLINFFALFDR